MYYSLATGLKMKAKNSLYNELKRIYKKDPILVHFRILIEVVTRSLKMLKVLFSRFDITCTKLD